MSKNFFIIGAQKAGTTALHSYLSRHPDIYMSKRKELHFFDNEEIDWSAPDYSEFEKHFPDRLAVVRGETTPVYMYWPNSMERLKAYDPAAKIIVLLRHPTFRALSHWKMVTRDGRETLTFWQAINQEGRKRVAGSPGGAHRAFSYVERGFYADQMRRLLSLFPRERVHFITTDQLRLHLNWTLASIEDFLGVPNRLKARQEYVMAASTDTPTGLDNRARELLDSYFFPEIRQTADITGLDLSAWQSADYAEPVRDKRRKWPTFLFSRA